MVNFIAGLVIGIAAAYITISLIMREAANVSQAIKDLHE